MSHFECRLNWRWSSKIVVQVVQIGGGGILEKIQKASNFFSVAPSLSCESPRLHCKNILSWWQNGFIKVQQWKQRRQLAFDLMKLKYFATVTHHRLQWWLKVVKDRQKRCKKTKRGSSLGQKRPKEGVPWVKKRPNEGVPWVKGLHERALSFLARCLYREKFPLKGIPRDA